MEYLLLFTGSLILVITLLDFFYTTLSGNGSGKVTDKLNDIVAALFLMIMSPGTKKWAGLIHLLLVLVNWLVWVIIGGFLIFSSNPSMVLQSSGQMPASWSDRLYYTCYVLSTLGNGDFMPGNSISQLFSVLFSITGFVMLTTAMTYLLSVATAVTVKKNLATFISRMGSNPLKLYDYTTISSDASLLINRTDNLVKMLINHANDHLSFPIVHHFLTDNRSRSAAVQISSLNETVTVLLVKFSGQETVCAELNRIRRAIRYFLDAAQIQVSDIHLPRVEKELVRNRLKFGKELYTYASWDKEEQQMFSYYLRSAGWDWGHVYEG